MEKDMVNLGVGVSKDLIENAIKEVVMSSILSSINNELFVKSIVDSVLGVKVDKSDGKPTTSSYNSVPYLDYVVSKEIKELVKDEIKAMFAEKENDFRTAIRKAIQSKKFINSASEKMLEAIMDSVQNPYKTKIEIEFDKDDEY